MSGTILKALLVSQFEALKASLFANIRKKRKNGHVKGKKSSIVLYSIIFIYIAVCIGIMMFGVFSEIAEPYHMMGLDWLYFSMFALIDFGAMFISTVFTAKTQIYEAKDNDLLLSMPIPTEYILISRLMFLLLMNLFFGLLITAPALLAWILYGSRNAAQILVFLLIAFLLPFFSLSVTALFGWILSLLTRRVRNKAMFTTVFSLLFIGAYFYFVANMNKLITNLAANSAAIAGKLGAVAPVYWLGSSVGNLDLRHLLYSALCLIVPFIICYYILSATLIKTITASHSAARIEYRERRTEQKSPFSALCRREFTSLFSSAIYLLNCGIGALMTFAAGIAIIFAGEKFSALFTGMTALSKDVIIGIFTLVVCMLISICNINAASVSMEGKSLWISKSLPVKTSDILKSKLLLQASFAAPSTLMASIGVAVTVKPGIVSTIILLIFPQLFAAMLNVMDLSINIAFPMLDWTNESQPCKTGTSVMLGLFIPWGITIVLGFAGWFALKIMPLTAVFAIIGAVIVAVTLILYHRLMTRGCADYDNL